jgi:hypothetical protein
LLTLPATLASIAVTPANASVTAGTTSSLTATGTYSDGTTQNVTGSVTWATTNSGIATVNAQGVATGVSPGNITVSATSGAITGSAGLTVTPATLVSVALSPQVTGIAVGATQQFIATGNYSDGSTQNLTNSLTWNSSNPAVATVNTGLATAVSAGTAVISATSGATVGSANLSVGQIVLQSIAVTPANPTIALGTTQQLSATGTYSDNSTLDVTNSATWSVSNNAVVSVNPGGVATALGIGSASVKAALGSISNSITITGYLGPIPSSFFGLHVNTSASNVTVPYGRCRIWGVQGTLWRSIEASQGVYNFASLDGTLAAAKLAGINDGCVFTFGSVPPWASTNPADNTCDKPGSCWPPADLNFDGSGTDQTIIDALTNIATHVNDPIYLQTHAHIKYWEPWNETYRGTFIGAYGCTSTHTCSFNGSYAQLVRIAEEMRCIIKGSGSVNSVPCTNAGIDPSASIITPSGQAYIRIYGRQEVPNFLQCNQNPLAGSGCSTGSRGSAAVDVVNYHCYVRSGNADDVAGYIALSRALLTPVDAAKPFYCDEGSWGPNTSFPDPDLQAGFTARWFTDILSEQVTTALWFTWDNQGWGTLWNPDGRNGCTQTAGCMTKAGVAYAQTYNWLIGANLQGCLSSNGITVCTLSRANGYSALMIWSTATLTSCIGQISSEVCGSTTYQVPSGYITKRDLDGLVQPANPTEYVGAKPILLENH